jgi:hypothetical protein
LRFWRFWHGGSAKDIFAPYTCLFLLNNKKGTVKDQFNQICGGFRGWLNAFVTDTSLEVCLESLHRSELAAFFAYDAQRIVIHLNPTNFSIDRDTGPSGSF